MATTTTQHGRLLWALIAGTAVLFMVLGYGLLLRPQAPTTPAPAAESTLTERERGREREIDASMQDQDPPSPHTANTPATTALVTDQDDTAVDQTPFITPDTDAQMEAASDADQRALAQQQLDYLQQMVPDTLMLPRDKTDPELEQMLADLQLHRELQQRIDDNSATDDDRLQYYQLHRQKLEQEKALLDICEELDATSLEDETVRQAQLCTHMAQSAPQRREAIEQSLLELEDLLYAHHE